MVFYSKARVFPTSSNYSSVEKEYKNDIFYTQPGPEIQGIGVNIDRQSYKHTAKKTDIEKNQLKGPSKQRFPSVN